MKDIPSFSQLDDLIGIQPVQIYVGLVDFSFNRVSNIDIAIASLGENINGAVDVQGQQQHRFVINYSIDPLE